MNEAIDALKIAVSIQPDDEIAVHALADGYYRVGQYSVAVKLLEPMREKKANLEYVLTTLIQCYEAMDDKITASLRRRELEDLRYE